MKYSDVGQILVRSWWTQDIYRSDLGHDCLPCRSSIRLNITHYHIYSDIPWCFSVCRDGIVYGHVFFASFSSREPEKKQLQEINKYGAY